MAVTDVVSGASAVFPCFVCRDSNNIPYVLVMDNTTLKVFKGNAATPTGWISANVGDGNAYGDSVWSPYMVTYTDSGTEYIGVFRVNDDQDVVFDRSTIGAFSFPSGSTITVDATSGSSYFTAADYGEDRLVVVYRVGSNVIAFQHSTDGGATWSGRTNLWSGHSWSPCHGPGVAWNGSHWFFYASHDQSSGAYFKRWSSGGGIEYWDGDSWETSAATNDGDGPYGIWTGYGVIHGKATSNIIAFGHGGSSSGYSGVVLYSLDNGQTWTAVPGMEAANYASRPSFTIKTEAGEVDDLYVWASNFDSSFNDTNYNLYDFSGASWSGWNLIWDSGDTADTVGYFAALLLQLNDWVDFAYQWYDSSATTYYVRFNQYEVGTSGATEYSKTVTGDLYLKEEDKSKTITGDLYLLEGNQSKIITGDLYILEADKSKTITGDLILLLQALKTVTGDLFLKGDDQSKTITGDLIVGITGATEYSKTITGDLILWSGSLAYSRDPHLYSQNAKTYTRNPKMYTQR